MSKLQWPVCRPMIVAMLENGEEYCIEGFAITPEHASQVIGLFPDDIRACFLGYCTVDAQRKWLDERQYPTTNAWPAARQNEEALAEIEFMKQVGIELQEDCARKGFRFFDTSTDFEEVITTAEEYLTKSTTTPCT